MYHDWIGDPEKHPRGPGNLPMTIIDSLRLDAEDFMFFDPAKLDEEFNRTLQIAKRIGTNTDLIQDIAETNAHLVNWTGDAATEFKRRLGAVDEYCDLQQTNIALVLQGLLMAFQLAVHAWADYLELAEATIAAAEHEIGEESKRDAIAAVSIGQAVVESVLDFKPEKIITQGATLLVKIGAETLKRNIEGNDADYVIGNIAVNRQRRPERLPVLHDAIEPILEELLREVEAVPVAVSHLLLFPQVVEGPNFNYEYFQSTRAGAPGPSAPMVEEERQKNLQERKQHKEQESEIDRRLNHGDKGAI